MAKATNTPTMENFVLEGKIYWANLWRTDQYKKYSFTLANLDDTNVDIAERANLKVHRDKEDWGAYVKLQRKELNSKNEANGPIVVTDKDKRAWDTSKGIGNGSLVKTKGITIEYEEGSWTNKVERVKVLNHVPYELEEGAVDRDWETLCFH